MTVPLLTLMVLIVAFGADPAAGESRRLVNL
jgi:hypothetical protein